MQKGSKTCKIKKKGECLKRIQTAQFKNFGGFANLSLVGKILIFWFPIV